MISRKELIKFCEEMGFERCDFEIKDHNGNKTGGSCPRFFTNVNPKDEKNDGKLIVIQFDDGVKPNGKLWSRVFIGLCGSSVRTNFDHLKITEKGLEWWRQKDNIGITESTEVLISR